MPKNKASFAVIERLIFSLWIVPNPVGHIITSLPRSKKRNVAGFAVSIALAVLSILFVLMPETSDTFVKVAMSVLVGLLVALVIFALARRIRRMK